MHRSAAAACCNFSWPCLLTCRAAPSLQRRLSPDCLGGGTCRKASGHVGATRATWCTAKGLCRALRAWSVASNRSRPRRTRRPACSKVARQAGSVLRELPPCRVDGSAHIVRRRASPASGPAKPSPTQSPPEVERHVCAAVYCGVAGDLVEEASRKVEHLPSVHLALERRGLALRREGMQAVRAHPGRGRMADRKGAQGGANLPCMPACPRRHAGRRGMPVPARAVPCRAVQARTGRLLPQAAPAEGRHDESAPGRAGSGA